MEEAVKSKGKGKDKEEKGKQKEEEGGEEGTEKAKLKWREFSSLLILDDSDMAPADKIASFDMVLSPSTSPHTFRFVYTFIYLG